MFILLVLHEIYRFSLPLDHMLEIGQPVVQSGLYFDGIAMKQPYTRSKHYTTPVLGQSHPSQSYMHQNYSYAMVPHNHGDIPKSIEKDFSPQHENIDSLAQFKGYYLRHRPLNEGEKRLLLNEKQLIYSDGKNIFIPFVDQRLWMNDENQLCFLIISYKDGSKVQLNPNVLFRNSTSNPPSFFFKRGLYQLRKKGYVSYGFEGEKRFSRRKI